MAPYIFYEPFYFEIERFLNDACLPKEDHKADTPVVRTFKPRYVHTIHTQCFFQANSNNEYRLDVQEDLEKNVVTATFDFPGFSNDDVQINFQNGKLTVSAETKNPESLVETGYTLRERLHGKFSRTLQLPEGVQVCRFLINMFQRVLTHLHRMSRSKPRLKMVF